MKKISRIISYCLVAAFFTIALSGCTKKATVVDPNANKIVVWGFEDPDVWKEMANDFTGVNKNFEVVYEKQTFDKNYENRVLNSILAGSGPDVWAMPNDWVYRHKEKLAPMPDTLSESINLDSYVPVIKKSVQFDNKTYALSATAEPLMIFVNSKLLQSRINELEENTDSTTSQRIDSMVDPLPQTWDKFVETTKLLTKKDGENITLAGAALGTENISHAADILYLLMLQNGTKVIADDLKVGTFNLSKETSTDANDFPGRRAIDFYTSFANKKSPNYIWSDSLGSDIDAFGNNKTILIFGFSRTANQIRQKFPNLEFEKAFMPQLYNDDPAKIIDYAKFNAYGVNKLSSKAAPSWELINMISTISQATMVSGSGLYTSTKSSSYDISIKNRDNDRPEELSLATANSIIKGRYPEEFDNTIRYAISEVLNGVQNSAGALNLAATTINDLLAKTIW